MSPSLCATRVPAKQPFNVQAMTCLKTKNSDPWYHQALFAGSQPGSQAKLFPNRQLDPDTIAVKSRFSVPESNLSGTSARHFSRPAGTVPDSRYLTLEKASRAAVCVSTSSAIVCTCAVPVVQDVRAYGVAHVPEP